MIEVPGSYLIDEKKWSRKKAAWTVGVLAFIVGIPSALSGGASEYLTKMSINLFGETKTSFLDIMDSLWGGLFIVIVALMTCIYTGWIMDVKKVATEIGHGAPMFEKKIFGKITAAQLWIFFIRYVCPLVILTVLLNMIGVFGVFSGT